MVSKSKKLSSTAIYNIDNNKKCFLSTRNHISDHITQQTGVTACKTTINIKIENGYFNENNISHHI